MNRRAIEVGAAALGLAVLGWIAWGAYTIASTERVAYRTVRRLDGVEIREYPERAVATTTAPDADRAFGRLFRYITGANVRDDEMAMTAPVASCGEEIATTAPVATRQGTGDVRMDFFLPEAYSAASAPAPTDPEVSVESRPSRTVAVLSFSGYATDGRVRAHREQLLDALEAFGIETDGEPTLLQYNDPFTPPFMRRNEVAVEIAEPPVGNA